MRYIDLESLSSARRISVRFRRRTSRRGRAARSARSGTFSQPQSGVNVRCRENPRIAENRAQFYPLSHAASSYSLPRGRKRDVEAWDGVLIQSINRDQSSKSNDVDLGGITSYGCRSSFSFIDSESAFSRLKT